MLMMSLLTLAIGILTIVNPFKAFMLITKLVGIFMVGNSVLELLILNLFKRRSNALLEMFK